MRDAEPGLDRLRIRERPVVAALRLHRDTDDRSMLDIKSARVDQVAVDHRVEIRVVGHVVNVAVDVVVHPACRDGEKMRVVSAPFWIVAHRWFAAIARPATLPSSLPATDDSLYGRVSPSTGLHPAG